MVVVVVVVVVVAAAVVVVVVFLMEHVGIPIPVPWMLWFEGFL